MRTRHVELAAPAGGALPRAFYERPTLLVAEELLGKVLVHSTAAGVTGGIIVETEAYIGEDDPACHAAPGPTLRNAPLYGPPGIAYVYLNYGLHYLVNAVTESAGRPAAVLIRALQPIEGAALMRERRVPDGRQLDQHALCRGPGNLTRALGITLAENGRDLTSGTLTIEDRGFDRGRVVWGPRIGISVATERPWRSWIDGNPAVSRRNAAVTARTSSRARPSASLVPSARDRRAASVRGREAAMLRRRST